MKQNIKLFNIELHKMRQMHDAGQKQTHTCTLKKVLYSTKSGYLARNHKGITFGAI